MLGWMMFINLYAQIDLDQSIEIPIDIDLLNNLPNKYAPTTTIFINLIQANELEELNFLSPIQCASIIQHRTLYGPFLHAQELIQCNLNIEQIDSLFPSLDFSTSMIDEWRSIQSHFLGGTLTFSGRLKPPTSALPSSALNSHWGHEFKMKYSVKKNFEIGLSFETDPGEKSIDFYSGFLCYKGKSRLKMLILGNFVTQWNKGLVFGSSGQFGSPISLENYTYQPVSMKAYSSYNEDIGHFGAAFQLHYFKTDFYAGYGIKPIDCQLNTTGNSFIDRSFGGLHQSELQRKRRHNNLETLSFIGTQKSLKKTTINLCLSNYKYLIPKVEMIEKDSQLSFSSSYLEIQIAFPRILNGRWIANHSIQLNNANTATYIAGVYSILKSVDFGMKFQRVNINYSAPELSYRLKSQINQNLLEMGFDIQATRKFNLKLRTEILEGIVATYRNNTNQNDIRNTLLANYHFSKNAILLAQFRRETAFSLDGSTIGKSFYYQSQISQKIKISQHSNLEFGFTQKWNNVNLLVNHLYHLGYSHKIGKYGTINIESNWFNCNETNIYGLDNSLPGNLGYMIYSGIGKYYNAILKIHLYKKLWLNLKLQKMQKMNVKNTTEIDGNSSYNRIFVQINFQ